MWTNSKAIFKLFKTHFNISLDLVEVKVIVGEGLTKTNLFITNFIGHDLAIIIMQNSLFIGLYGIDTNVIHLLILFEH